MDTMIFPSLAMERPALVAVFAWGIYIIIGFVIQWVVFILGGPASADGAFPISIAFATVAAVVTYFVVGATWGQLSAVLGFLGASVIVLKLTAWRMRRNEKRKLGGVK